MHASFLIIFLALSYRSWYILFYAQSAFTDVSFPSGSQTIAIAGENLLRQLSITKNDYSSFLDFIGGMSVSACTLLRSGLTLCQEITSLKKRMLVHL